MIADALAWLVQGAIASTVALLCVLALRGPMRAMFGARAAYGLWMLLPGALLAVSLPGPVVDFALGSTGGDLGATSSVRVGLATALQPVASAMAPERPGAPALLALAWACGALTMALWFWHLQRRFVSGLGTIARRDDGLFRAQTACASPVVIGAWRPRIVLPSDFDARYPAEEGVLVIAHEREHVRRSDVRINLLAAGLRCLYWFNPLLHWASAKFRFDQELACDAAVLAAHPESRRAYAGAMLKTQLAVLGLPVGCHWQSSQALKERILMLKKPQPGALRRCGGIAAVAAVLAASSFGVWALQPTSMTAPIHRGFVEENGVAIASVRVPEGMDVHLRGPSMSGALGGQTTTVMLDPRIDLRIAKNGDHVPWALRIWGTGTPEAPGAKWTLERDGRVVDEGSQAIPAGAPSNLDLALPVDAAGHAPAIALSRLPADRIVIREDRGVPTLVRDADGAYRETQPIFAYGDRYQANGGKATLLVHVGVDGRVRRVEIERSEPAGSLDAEHASDLVRRNVYAPQRSNGRAVPSRIRVPVEFWRDTPPMSEPVVAGRRASDTATSTPAPDYPAGALAAKQDGHVLLHLLVASDGSVKDVRVMLSHPKGVFDAVSIEAARKWKLQPPIKDGKAVEGWLQVPITFDPKGKPAASGAGAMPEKV